MNFYRNRLALGAIPQIPRGGILGPDALANLELWFDATTIVGVSNGDAVPQWDDLSGNERHATEATIGRHTPHLALTVWRQLNSALVAPPN
jgi:hypothetical protein